MNTSSNAAPEISVPGTAMAAGTVSPARIFYWTLRRELWEHRAIYLAPLIVAGVFVLGFLVGHVPGGRHGALPSDPNKQHELLAQPYHFSALLLMGTAVIVALFYCLDALHGERRDRSILFWKSLPVSDLITVLAKATVPIVIVPVLTFVITAVTQGIIYVITAAVLAGNGLPAAILTSQVSLWQQWVMLFYHLVGIHGLWYAPIYSWLLLVSAWARRAPLLWAFLPPFAIGVLEKITFNTAHFVAMLGYRFMGGAEGAKYVPGTMEMNPLAHLSPGHFLTSSGLWSGFIVAAIFLAVAVRLRRYRDPI